MVLFRLSLSICSANLCLSSSFVVFVPLNLKLPVSGKLPVECSIGRAGGEIKSVE